MAGIDAQTRADLLEIIDDRAVNKATIITSQLPIEHWHAWVGDATIADAILDRVMQKNHHFTLTGESLRQKPKASKKEINQDPSWPTPLPFRCAIPHAAPPVTIAGIRA